MFVDIVRVALRKPYTFVVMALLILILGPLAALRMPTDIFPEIDIPIISVVWSYGGLPAQHRGPRIGLRSLAQGLPAKSPEVMRLARAAFGRACDMDYRRNVAEIVEAFCTIASTSDSQEGVNAFAAKRPPVWKPR